MRIMIQLVLFDRLHKLMLVKNKVDIRLVAL